MIGRITGRLAEKNPPQILVDVNGVGYELEVPMSTFYGLPATGQAVSLSTHLAVREDGHFLYGFATEDERAAFRQLLKVAGIGARTALAVLSGLSVADLAQAIALQRAAAW
jgi:Holliday junction DNA helicase RuvA